MANDEYYTPSYILGRVRNLGDIDLDPFSCELANIAVKAKTYYTLADDGFNQEWSGFQTIWINPPYSKGNMIKVVEKVLKTYEDSDLKPEILLLTNTDNSTKWYQLALANAAGTCFVNHRINFWGLNNGKKSNRHCQTLFYYGERFKAFVYSFSDLGFIV